MKPNVLIVDDVPANLVALEALLADFDCEVVCASGGNEALRQLLKREYAIVLLDVQMPGMDGYEVASLVRQNPAIHDLPIIFLTATHSSEENMLKGYDTGAIDFLLKPINAQVLRAKVSGFLELYLSRRKLADEIAAHKKTMSELEMANEALLHFTNAASHDLRAPLRTIAGFLGALAEDAGPSLDAQSRDYVDRSIKASLRMAALLDSLLSYARLRRPVMAEQLDCNVLVAQVKSDLAAALTQAGAELRVGPLPNIRGDQDRIYQLFLNLVGNALKFQRPEVRPVVEVSAEAQDGEWRFCVADNGIGIAPEHCRTIFEAFQRLHNQSRYEGSGLGLAICEQIVEQHGGRIWVESVPNEGCRFLFTLSSTASAS